jgi:hypothetical protein
MLQSVTKKHDLENKISGSFSPYAGLEKAVARPAEIQNRLDNNSIEKVYVTAPIASLSLYNIIYI